MTKLRLLDIRGCTSIDDTGLTYIKGLVNLKSLKLRNPSVTDEGLAQLAGMTKLSSLSIEDCNCTDDGLKVLKNMPDLEDLTIFRCINVTDDGLAYVAESEKTQTVFHARYTDQWIGT